MLVSSAPVSQVLLDPHSLVPTHQVAGMQVSYHRFRLPKRLLARFALLLRKNQSDIVRGWFLSSP